MSEKILIITPDFNLGVMIEARLSVEDYTTLLAYDGETGLAQIRKERPHLILLDAVLPGVSAYQVIQTLKNSAVTENLPVIIVSDRSEFFPLFKGAGVYGFMMKPIIPAQLLKQVQTALKASLGKKDPSSPPAPASKLKEEAPVLSHKTVLLAGAETFILEKIKKALESDGYSVEIGWNKEDISKKINQAPPSIFLLQYWDDPDVWDAAELVRAIRKDLKHNKVPLLIFCLEPLMLEVKSQLMQTPAIAYYESPDLLSSLKNYLSMKKI